MKPKASKVNGTNGTVTNEWLLRMATVGAKHVILELKRQERELLSRFPDLARDPELRALGVKNTNGHGGSRPVGESTILFDAGAEGPGPELPAASGRGGRRMRGEVTPRSKVIVDWFAKHGPSTPKLAAKALGLERKEVAWRVKTATKAGVLTKGKGRGMYAAADK